MLTHGLNGIRNTVKNKIQELDGGRKDYKIDCIVSEFKDGKYHGIKNISNRWCDGFIGMNLIKRLVSEGHSVLSLDDYSTGTEENHVEGIKVLGR